MTAFRIANLDCYFTIAKPHLVCEDYALTGAAPTPHLIVCDGCSSSENTDVGSRIIALSARKALYEHFTAAAGRNPPAYSDFGYAVINRARHVADLLGIAPACLDATLLAAFPYHNHLYVYIYGDGYVTTIDRAGQFAVTQLAYSQNMPYYLTYWLDPARRERYLQANQAGQAVVTVTEYRDGQEQVRKSNYDAPLVFPFALSECQILALTSDGVGSLLAAEANGKIPAWEILRQLVAYKTTKGDFVKRRARRMLKEYEKQGIYPSDDLSIATLLVSHE